MNPKLRRSAGFTRKALPAAMALIFGHAYGAGINDGGNAANLPTAGIANSATNVTSSSVSGNTMAIGISGKAIIDWSTFNIGQNFTVNFNGSGGAVLNRVQGGNPTNGSNIAGNLNGNNLAVMLMNPNGIAFTSTAVVSVGALVATTGTIDQNTFLNTGGAAITGATAGSSVTTAAGAKITASGNHILDQTNTLGGAGMVALVAPSVVNDGVIIAVKGKILLAGAQAATVSLTNGLYEFVVGQGAVDSEVKNGGTLTTAATATGTATEGTIVLSAPEVAGFVSGAINLSGIQRANRIEVHGNVVELKSDLVASTVTGTSNTVNVLKTDTGGGQIQDGIDIAKSGGTVNIGEGTFAESLSITKALTLDGAGMGKTVIDPDNSKNGIVVGGNIGSTATVTIKDLTVQGGQTGIMVLDNANLGTITLDGIAVLDNAKSGFITSEGRTSPPNPSNSTVSNVNIKNSVFAGNGIAQGTADINLFAFNGAATIKDVTILGTRGGSDINQATDYGLQIRGFGEVGNMTAAGVVKLENVRIAGNYRRAHLGIQRYSDASNITMTGVKLGGKLENVSVGTPILISVLSSRAGFSKFYSSDEHGVIRLGDTQFLTSGGDVPNPLDKLDIRIDGQTVGLRVDATTAVFKDKDGNTRTDNFEIESRVQHAMDFITSDGVVTWQAGNLYVTNDRSIDRGVAVASVGDTVNVQAGTYAENVSIGKALTLKGAGAGVGSGSSIIDPVSGDAISVSGNIGTDATLTIDGFTFKDAPRYGVTVAKDTVLKELKILNSDFRSNGQNGFALLGDSLTGAPGVTKVTFENDKFIGNGTATASSLGYGDILFDFYNGDAKFKNVQITGAGEFMGIQMRGASPTPNLPLPAGTIEFDGVTIDGSFLRPDVPNGNPRWHNVGTWNPGGPGDAIHLLEYSSVANVSFKDVTINLGAGHGMFLEGLGSTLNIGNTTFGENTNLSVLGIGAEITNREKVSRNIFVGSNDNGYATKVDASHATFTGASDGFAIENRVYHALDFSGLGLVTWNPGHLYVTLDSGSIQRGIDAACACDTVHVGAGTFTEQIKINKSLKLFGSGEDVTIVKAPTTLVLDRGMRSIVTIGGDSATHVEMSGFTVKGTADNLSAGIFVRDGAYAHIHHNKVLDIRETGPLSGNQTGAGIFVGRASLTTSGTALIEDNYITGYQKGGIVVDGPGSDATIRRNTVIGAGPTTAIAQNGIQVSRGASATITGNTVSGNVYTGPRGDADDFASGILFFISNLYLDQGGVTIGSGNTITANEFGIWTNDSRTLATTSLEGVSGNTRNAVAYFSGGYQTQADSLKYPAWDASNAALVNAGTFGGKQSGDIVDVGGALKVSGWNAFAAIQPAVNATASGASIDVATGAYAESVVLTGPRNLAFNNVMLQSLTIDSGAAGSGIQGSVTATGPGGFLFNAPVSLLGDTTLATTGANIVLNGDIQGFGGGAYALSLNAGTGDVTMVSGGSLINPLGRLEVDANNFTLQSTLWVSGYDINALGTVALSDHSLRSVGGGAPDAINAGGDVTGTTSSVNPVQIDAGGDVAANVTSQGAVVVEATNVSGNYIAPTIAIAAQDTINANVVAPISVQIDSGGPVHLSGESPSVDLRSPGGQVTGNFGQVTNSGGGLIEVNGRPQVNSTVAETASNNRVVPQEITTAASPDSGNTQRQGKVRRRKAEDAVEVLDNGESLEIDLSPSN